ncbi:MAG: hypothetical protein JRE58_07550 [Deltaproteobacteria bacterium]|nr:hypothetical protein [Deltaproteobacteria bacterium]
MKSNTQLILYGSLRKSVKGYNNAAIEVELSEPSIVSDFLQQFDVPVNRVQLVMLNHRAVHMESVITPGDRIALFPKEYPIFADWNDMRLKSV